VHTFLKLLLVTLMSCCCWACTGDPVRISCANGDMEVCRATLAVKPDLSEEKRAEYLWSSAFGGQRECVRFWYDNGATSRKALGDALLIAARRARPETTRLLLELGADPNFDGGVFGTYTPVTAVLWSPTTSAAEDATLRNIEPKNPFRTLLALYEGGANMTKGELVGGNFQQCANADPMLAKAFLTLKKREDEALRLGKKRNISEDTAEVIADFSHELSKLADTMAILELIDKAKAGDAAAAMELGDIYASGNRLVEKNEENAIALWKQAAVQGNKEAQERLRARNIRWEQ
jgi:hypothetical protein